MRKLSIPDIYRCPTCGNELSGSERVYFVNGGWICEMDLLETLHLDPARPGVRALMERICRAREMKSRPIASLIEEQAHTFREEWEEEW